MTILAALKLAAKQGKRNKQRKRGGAAAARLVACEQSRLPNKWQKLSKARGEK